MEISANPELAPMPKTHPRSAAGLKQPWLILPYRVPYLSLPICHVSVFNTRHDSFFFLSSFFAL